MVILLTSSSASILAICYLGWFRGPEPKLEKLVLADLQHETVVLEITAPGFGFVEYCSCKDSDTQDVVQVHMCWH